MKILMVCLGNICRSPLAEGIMQSKINDRGMNWIVESAGTSGWHVGELPDSRSIQIANKNGIDITNQRSRKFIKSDFEDFDYIFAMDKTNYKDLIAQSEDHQHKVKLFLEYAEQSVLEVPDPYYDGGFAYVFDLISDACEKLIQKLN